MGFKPVRRPVKVVVPNSTDEAFGLKEEAEEVSRHLVSAYTTNEIRSCQGRRENLWLMQSNFPIEI